MGEPALAAMVWLVATPGSVAAVGDLTASDTILGTMVVGFDSTIH